MRGIPLAAFLIASGCTEATSPAPVGVPAAVVVLVGDAQQGTVGQELPEPLAVRVEDGDGRPVEGQAVNFIVVAGGGSIFAGSANTNANGEARERWTLGTIASDSQRVEARAVDSETGARLVFATFHATALPDRPDSLAIVTGTGEGGVVGQPLVDSVAVRIFDRYGNPVPDADVAWTSDDPGSSLDPSSSVTDSTGVARSEWRLGTIAGGQSARATHGALEVTLRANASTGSVAGMHLSPDTLRFDALGREQRLEARMLDAFGNTVTDAQVDWSSSDAAIIDVGAGGSVRSKSNGEAFVVGQAEGHADTAVVLVDQVPYSVGLTSARDSILIGDTVRYTARVTDSNGVVVEDAAVAWTSSDASVLQVGGDGLVDGIARGAASVTAESEGVVASRAVVVLRPDSIPPALAIGSPNNSNVARPEIRIVVNCTDDDPLGCESMTVLLPSGDTLARGAATIDTMVSLEAFEGNQVALRFSAHDPLNATTDVRRVFVESSTALAEAETVAGRILAADAGRILHWDSASATAAVRIYDRGSGTNTTVFQDGHPYYGYLTSVGALFAATGRRPSRMLEWRSGVLIDHGVLSSTSSLNVVGNYAIWSNQSELFRYDVTSGIETLVASDAGNWKNDVTGDGDVVYWNASFDIFRYRDGTTTRLTADDDAVFRNVYVVTDGTAVLYTKKDGCCGEYRIALLTDSTEIVLSELGLFEPNPDRDYAANGGWIAFRRVDDAGVLQVWRRSTAGLEVPVTSFDSPHFWYDSYGRIESMGPNGGIILIHEGRRFLSIPQEPLRELGSDLGRSLWIDDKPFVVIGTTLLSVRPM